MYLPLVLFWNLLHRPAISGKKKKGKGTEAASPDERISEADGSDTNLSIGVFFDNEEIGSLSKQGADSGLLRMITERILKRQRRETHHTGAASGDIFDLS